MRTSLVFLGVLLMQGAPTADGQQPAIQFDQYTLENGLTVILHEDHTAPVAAVVVMYHVGSKNEKPGRTGFAHLFEHMMFKGSAHVDDGEHFKLLQEIGATINGSTTEDRTNYFETVPSNYVELALYLESDRMGFLLPAVNQGKLDNQRDVVKNERRQNYDNQPYGTAHEKIARALYPPDHPYSWPVIGYMEDLSAASLNDVLEFFRVYYAPNNAVLVVAGDIDPVLTKTWIKTYFGPIQRGTPIVRPSPRAPVLREVKRLVFEDKVQLPRLYLVWHAAARGTREEAVADVLTSILSSGKNSRLYKSLVLDQQIAQSVSAYVSADEIAGTASVEVTAKPGRSLAEMERAVRKVLNDVIVGGVGDREIQAAVNSKESQLINRLTTVFGKANSLATYHTLNGDAALFNRELDRFRGITPTEVQGIARTLFGGNNVALSVVPTGRTDLAAESTTIPTQETPK